MSSQADNQIEVNQEAEGQLLASQIESIKDPNILKHNLGYYKAKYFELLAELFLIYLQAEVTEESQLNEAALKFDAKIAELDQVLLAFRITKKALRKVKTQSEVEKKKSDETEILYK